MKYFKSAVLFLIVFASNCNLFSQTDSIDVFVKNQMLRRGIPGLQLAIVRDGRIVKTANYGLANVQDSIPVGDKTVFTINSITKAFTGVAIMQLVEQGKLNLTVPISTYLSDLPKAWEPVTLQQLLSHTSGIPDIVDAEESVLISPAGEDASWKQVISMPMDFSPGERFRYNQTNYLLLGKVIDKISGMPFTEFIKKYQLEKAGMHKTFASGFGAPREIVMNTAGGYQYTGGKLSNMFFSFPPSLQTAAGMSSSATELANWIIALQKHQFLNETSLKTLWAPAILKNGKTGGFNGLLNGYAAGWPTIGREEHPAVAPIGGGRAALFVYPNDNLSIIVLTNLSGGSPEGFIDEIAGFFIPDMKESNGFGFSKPLKLIRAQFERSGYTNAIEKIRQIRKGNTTDLSEKEINTWGYRLVSQNRLKDALEIFKLNVFLYPNSSNVYDSLGEIYAELGEKELAIKNYTRSGELDPSNTNAEKQIQKLRSLK